MPQESQVRTAKRLLQCVNRAAEMGSGIILLGKCYPELPPEEYSDEEKIILENSVNIVLLTPEVRKDDRVTDAFGALNIAIGIRKAELGLL